VNTFKEKLNATLDDVCRNIPCRLGSSRLVISLRTKTA